ncbi:hypothetical protein J4Q44_G00171840 [Coregonus suidteri]|uniref:NEDD8-conjugating enzyme UBC12 n=1 Tax=Coregonus suidteri TaxID=861788 RepID=A0AAN8LHM8_9TELE
MIKLFSLKQQKKDEESAGGNRTGAGGKKASAAQLRIQKDINELNLPKTCEIVFPDQDDLLNFKLIISPDEGFYKGGKFVFSFKVGQGYPHDPPKVKCETMVYHPNIDLEGNVCLNILREDWKPVLTVNSIIYGLQYLFLTKEVVKSMKINGNITGVSFSHDGSKVFTNSEEGEVYIWDMRSSKCLNRFTDDGCVSGTSIAASRNGQYLACGSAAGVVNVYSQEVCMRQNNPKPLKAIMNLVTSATSLRFNPTSEILAIASRADDEAARLVHIPSFTVFSNFPMFQRKTIYRAHCLDFSPNSGFFSLANNKGHAPLFRLLHYKDF